MGVFVKLSGQKGATFRVTERVFPVVEDARAYLREIGVNEKEKTQCDKVGDVAVFCSHPIRDVFRKDQLADNEYVPRRAKLTLPKPPPDVAAAAPSRRRSSPPTAKEDGKARTAKVDGPTLNLKQICQELKLDPRKARQTLRKKLGNTTGRWEWPVAEAEQVKTILRQQ